MNETDYVTTAVLPSKYTTIVPLTGKLANPIGRRTVTKDYKLKQNLLSNVILTSTEIAWLGSKKVPFVPNF